MGERVERKLTAILAADVAGYSRLMAADEEGTLSRLKAHRRELIDIKINECRGRIIKTTGDGMLVEFASVVDAVRCAVDVQRGMEMRNAEISPDRRIDFRVGINIGDVIVDGDDIYGDGVNIAARLENIADSGGICVSSTVRDHVLDKLSFDFDDLGERKVKNIPRPVRVYRVQLGDGGSQSAANVTATPTQGFMPPRLSIVVLPFANIGGDPEQEYFVDGVAESLTTDLSRISGSFVIARNTAFTYRGKPVHVKQIGRELNVRYVLEGSVQRGGNRLRVNVQLIDAETGNHLWAERFDKPLADLFDMQDEIVARLANTLNAHLVAAEARRAEKVPHPDSLDLYFQGMAWLNRGWTPEHLDRALRFFDEALALDPANVSALVGSGTAKSALGGTLYGVRRDTHFAEAEASVTKALSLAPEHPMGHAILGWLQIMTNRAARGIVECERALALDPNLAFAHGAIGLAYFLNGRCAEVDARINEALRLSPRDVNAYVWLSYAGCARAYLGANDDAVIWFRRAVDTNRNFPSVHFWLGAALANLGRLDEARAEVAAGLALDPAFAVSRFRAGAGSDNPTFLVQREQFVIGMRKAGVPEGAKSSSSDAPRLSIVVLPFANLGGDPEQEYFVDGVTESLTTDLSRISGSFVIARNTAFTYKGKPADVKQIGRELNVRYVLEGSVQRGGSRLRVNVQLIDAETGNHLWAERFDKPLADLFDMQDEIVARLARTLEVQLNAAEVAVAKRKAPQELDSLDLSMRGWALVNQNFTTEAAREARPLFQSAITLDERNVDALLGLSMTYSMELLNYASPSVDLHRAASMDAVRRAIQLAPNNARAHLVHGYILRVCRQPQNALHALDHAILLNPNLAEAHGQAAYNEIYLGRAENAEARIEAALRLSPRDPAAGVWYLALGLADYYLNRFEQSVDRLRKATEVSPSYGLAYYVLAAGLARIGRDGEAAAACATGRTLHPEFTSVKFKRDVWSDNPTYLAQRERLYEGFHKAGVPEE